MSEDVQRSLAPEHAEGSLAGTDQRSNSNADDDLGDEQEMELQNPSDALHILANLGASRCEGSAYDEPSHIAPAETRNGDSSLNSGAGVLGERNASEMARERPSCTARGLPFDDYDLVKRRVLHPGAIPELLHE